MINLLAFSALGIAAATGGVLGYLRRGLALFGLFLTLVLIFAICWMMQRYGEGRGDIGYAVVAYLLMLPGAAGLLGGALIGWLVARHRRA